MSNNADRFSRLVPRLIRLRDVPGIKEKPDEKLKEAYAREYRKRKGGE